MADEGANAGEVFRRSTMNRIASADELDHYIKVTNPSAWVVTIAALLLIAGVIIWAVVAIVPVTVETTGIHYRDSSSGENVVLCWVDKSTAQKIEDSGAKASIDGETVQVPVIPCDEYEQAFAWHHFVPAEAFLFRGQPGGGGGKPARAKQQMRKRK